MKQILKIGVLTCLLILLCMVPAFADTQELTFDVTTDFTNPVIYISWENDTKSGSVEITGPDGSVYSKSKTPDAVYEAKGEAIVKINQTLAKGSWSIKVTGDNLGKITADIGDLPNSMNIDTFEVEPSGDKYVAKYSISDCPEEVQLNVFADTDNSGFDGRSVYSGTGAPSGSLEFDMNYLDSGEYHFYLVVSKDGAFKRTYATSVISHQRDGAQKVASVRGGKYNDGYYIRWENEEEYKTFTVKVWDENKNLINEEEVKGLTNFYYGDFDEGTDEVYLAVTENNQNNYDLIHVSKDTVVDAKVTYDVEDDITNHNYIVATVEFAGKCNIEALLNGEYKIQKETEPGQFKVAMSDGNNEVAFLITDEQGNMLDVRKDIYVDTVAPALSISKDVNRQITSKNHIYISGYSEAGANLTINGKKVTMQKGWFSEKVELDYGHNTIEVIAKDTAGNTSVYTAKVERQMSKTSRTRLYIYVSVVLILLIIYLIVFLKGMKRRKRG